MAVLGHRSIYPSLLSGTPTLRVKPTRKSDRGDVREAWPLSLSLWRVFSVKMAVPRPVLLLTSFSLIDVLRCQDAADVISDVELLTFKMLSTSHADSSVTIFMLLTSRTTADVRSAPDVLSCCWLRLNCFCHLVPVLTYLQDNFWCPVRLWVDIWDACCHIILRTSVIHLTIFVFMSFDMLAMTHILLTSCCAVDIWEARRSAVLLTSKSMLRISSDFSNALEILFCLPIFNRFCWSWPSGALIFKLPMTNPWSL